MSEEHYRHHMTRVSAPLSQDLMAKYGIKRWTMVICAPFSRIYSPAIAQLYGEKMKLHSPYDCFSITPKFNTMLCGDLVRLSE